MRKIIFFENHFINFYRRQPDHVKSKIKQVLELIKQVDRVPVKFLKHLAGTQGLYEIRVAFQSNIYRIFCCFDKGDLVVLFNAFHKKGQKTPKSELSKAQRLMKTYFESKADSNEGIR